MAKRPQGIEYVRRRLRSPAAHCSSLLTAARDGFTVLELLIVMGVVSVLTAILLPAIGATREAARQLQCKNQLKQIGLALHNYHDICGSFPAGWQWEATKTSAYGWVVPLLPFLEQRPIYDRTYRNLLLTHPHNTVVRQTSIGLLLCPSDTTAPTFMLAWEDESAGSSGPLFELPTANYFGVFGTNEPDELNPPPTGDGTFIELRPIRLIELQRGSSNTIIVGERTMARVPSTWLGVDRQGADANCRLVGNAWTSPNCDLCDECEFASRHPGGANFLWGDGRVEAVSQQIDSREYQRLARRADD